MISRDAAKEAKAERQLKRDSVGEEVFLAQLHRRALLLNDGFQNQIVQVLNRYETVNSVRSKSNWSQSSDMSGSAMRFSADLLLRSNSMSESFSRKGSTMATSISERSWHTADAAVVLFECNFADGVGAVEVHQAPIKTWVGP